jgi:hypothetical protein
MDAYEDPDHEGNSEKYHTGKKCIEGCGRLAGTKWSHLWCFECNVKRIKRINKRFATLKEELL